MACSAGRPFSEGRAGESCGLRMQKNDSNLRVLIVAPIGGDARTMGTVLTRHGIKTQICHDPVACTAALKRGAGVLLLTEEALEMEGASHLRTALQSQAAWSELPL